MPKYFCDYCDTYLTHDSPSVRKTHNAGKRHKDNVKFYYQKWMEDEAQSLVDATTAMFKATKSKQRPFGSGGMTTNPALPRPPHQGSLLGMPGNFPPGMPPMVPGMPPMIPGMPSMMVPPPGGPRGTFPGMPVGMPPLGLGMMRMVPPPFIPHPQQMNGFLPRPSMTPAQHQYPLNNNHNKMDQDVPKDFPNGKFPPIPSTN